MAPLRGIKGMDQVFAGGGGGWAAVNCRCVESIV